MSRKRAEFQWQATPAARRQIFYGRLQTDVTAAKELRLFGLGDFLHGRMLREMRSIHRAERRLDLRMFWTQGGLGLVTAVISAAGLIWTIRQAAAGRLTVGDVTLYVMAAVGVQSSLSATVTRIASVYEAVLMFGYYDEVVMAGPDLALAAEPVPLPALRGGLELRDVWFRYDEDHPWVLQGVNMVIPAGDVGRADRAQRRGQEHAGEAALPAVRPGPGHHLAGTAPTSPRWRPPSCARGSAPCSRTTWPTT